LAHEAVTRLEHTWDCSRRQVQPYLFLAAGRPRQSAFSQGIPESNYPTPTTLVVVAHYDIVLHAVGRKLLVWKKLVMM